MKRSLPALLYALLILTLSSIPGQKLSADLFSLHDKPLHILLYFGAFYAFYSSIRRPHLTLATVYLYAAFDEIYQNFIPGRHSSPYDWIADALGATLAYLLLFAFRHLYAPRKPSSL
ncbi:MAG: VanZ family protein [Methylacidiphilales bacterium]|nr:VanZ family protein [Candidatus Methylacidiphilales bacterium]